MFCYCALLAPSTLLATVFVASIASLHSAELCKCEFLTYLRNTSTSRYISTYQIMGEFTNVHLYGLLGIRSFLAYHEEFLMAAALLSMIFKPEKKETPDSLKVIIDVSFSGNLILLHSVSLCHHVNTSLIPTPPKYFSSQMKSGSTLFEVLIALTSGLDDWSVAIFCCCCILDDSIAGRSDSRFQTSSNQSNVFQQS